MPLLRFALVLASILAAVPAFAATSSVVDLTVSGTRVRFLYVRPDGPVHAHLVSISGGDGTLNIADDGSMGTVTAYCGPVTRNREALANSGIALALMDVWPSTEHMAAVVAYLRERHAVPVWISGGSASTGQVPTHLTSLDPSVPAGGMFFAPARLSGRPVASIARPVLVVAHERDSDAFPGVLMSALTRAPVKERVVIRGGTDTAPCRHHLFWGADADFIAAVTDFISRNNAATAPAEVKHQALWYAAPAESEPGWGVNIAHQGDILFATWFTYDAEGPMWLVMSNGAKVGPRRYQGTLYRTRGPAFDAVPFDPSLVAVSEAGSATFEFSDDSNGTFSYTVGGISQSKAITRQVYSSPVPRCIAAAPSEDNFQDLWWNPAESGWGVNLTHQGDILFGTWFTYARDGKGQWLVMSNLSREGTRRYSGDIYRTTGAPFNAYDRSRLSVTPVGRATFQFSGADAGTFTYTLDGVTQTKPITRQVFSTPTWCR